MAFDATPKTKCDATILHTWTGGAVTVIYEPGDFTWDVPGAAVDLFLDRGKIGATPLIRLGDEGPMTFGYSAYLTDLGDTAAVYSTLPDAIWRFAGAYAIANFTSVLSGTDAVTNTTTYTISGTATGEADQTLGFPHSTMRASGAEGSPTTISVSATSHAVKPTLA